ncbi:uncharacterized protein AMSG_09305 [Thecamonas trahens ATCC 50062]|uniref:Ubiquitin-like domain-containing protein n=1 Tax=Thecamonas trahens ATCC 50062 TaxID=461836 RepID=A0A0L0DP68_THETB|nr:hypothetical protein AMSG_09305 [Thecamonas trahens ATCC 50062]KNC53218.1 hypothetical protein AMSG_09305 [Thecamonas trahens ATCC 50062]|eukprot:XP_013754687.1 hypothetical protein AMSG_09305 [Thecamonas trahens ATCC 50062]
MDAVVAMDNGVVDEVDAGLERGDDPQAGAEEEEPVTPPPPAYERPALALPHSTWVELRLRLVFPQGIVWTKRVNLAATVAEIKRFLVRKHGNSVRNIALYNGERAPENELCDDAASLYGAGVAVSSAVGARNNATVDAPAADKLAVFAAYETAVAEAVAFSGKTGKKGRRKGKRGKKKGAAKGAASPASMASPDPVQLTHRLPTAPSPGDALPAVDLWYDFDIPRQHCALVRRPPDLSVYNLASAAQKPVESAAARSSLLGSTRSRLLRPRSGPMTAETGPKAIGTDPKVAGSGSRTAGSRGSPLLTS